MAKSDSELLLSEIAKKLRTLQCICENTANSGGAIVKDYQPLDCNGDPVGSPLNVLPTISVAKQDVRICNTDAITGGTFNKPITVVIPNSTDIQLSALAGSIDITKLHSVSLSVLSGTVDINGDLGGGSQSATGLPKGTNILYVATTTFDTGDIEIITDPSGTVLITLMLSN